MKKQTLKLFLGFCIMILGFSILFSGYLLIAHQLHPTTTGIVFIDANGNGKKDTTERGISQEQFTLVGKDGKKNIITTNLQGKFITQGLVDGVYKVVKNNSSQKIKELTITKNTPLSIAVEPFSPSFQIASNTDFEDQCSSFNGNASLCNQQANCYNRWGVGCVKITSGGGIGPTCGNGYDSYCALIESCVNRACVPNNSYIPCNGRCSSTETCQTHEGVELCVPNTFSRAAPDPICNQNGDSCCFNGTDYYCQGPNNVCNLQNHRCSIIVNDLITNDDSLDKVREISANGRDDYGDYYVTNSLITCRDPRVISYRETISFPANQTASIRIRKMCNYHNQSGSCVTGRDDQGNYARCDYGNSPPITCDAEGSACCTNSSGQKYCTGQNMNCKKINSQPICSKIVNPVIDSDLSGQLSIKEGDKFYFAPDFIFNSEAFATVSNVRCENNEVRLHFTLDDEVAQQPKVETEGIFYCNYNNQYGRCVEGVQNGVKFAKCDYNNLPAATCSDTTPYRCPNNTCAANQAACNATPPLVLPGGTTPPAVNTPPTVNTPTPDPNRGCNQGFSRARNNDAICCPNDFPFNIPGSENGGLGVCVETNPNPSQPINTPDTGSSDQPSQNGESCGNATCTPDRYCRRDIQGLEFCALKDISTASGEKCGSRTCDGNFEVCFSYKSCNSASLAADSSAFCVGKNGTEGSACCGNTVGDCAANLECTKNTKAGTDSVGICCPKGSKLVNNVCVSSSSPNSDDTLATPNCGNQTCTNSQSCYQPPAQVPSCIESHSLGVGFYCNAPDQCQSNVCTNNWCQYVPEDVTPPNNESDNSSNPWMNIINNLIGDQTPEDARQNNPINDTTEITACSGDALPYFSGSCETPCMCTDGTECNPNSGAPADFARDYCTTDPNNQF